MSSKFNDTYPVCQAIVFIFSSDFLFSVFFSFLLSSFPLFFLQTSYFPIFFYFSSLPLSSCVLQEFTSIPNLSLLRGGIWGVFKHYTYPFFLADFLFSYFPSLLSTP